MRSRNGLAMVLAVCLLAGCEAPSATDSDTMSRTDAGMDGARWVSSSGRGPASRSSTTDPSSADLPPLCPMCGAGDPGGDTTDLGGLTAENDGFVSCAGTLTTRRIDLGEVRAMGLEPVPSLEGLPEKIETPMRWVEPERDEATRIAVELAPTGYGYMTYYEPLEPRDGGAGMQSDAGDAGVGRGVGNLPPCPEPVVVREVQAQIAFADDTVRGTITGAIHWNGFYGVIHASARDLRGTFELPSDPAATASVLMARLAFVRDGAMGIARAELDLRLYHQLSGAWRQAARYFAAHPDGCDLVAQEAGAMHCTPDASVDSASGTCCVPILPPPPAGEDAGTLE